MMNTVKKTACALVVLATTSTVVMAESIDVKVTGTITPKACKMALTGGGVVDYGAIQPSSLKNDALNQLENKQLDFSITCDSPAKIALTAIDGRPGTTAATQSDNADGTAKIPDGIDNNNGDFVVGLGLDGDKKIGGYTISISNTVADNVNVEGIFRSVESDAWTKWKGLPLISSNKIIGSVTKAGEQQPVAFTTLAGKLNVQAYINKTSQLDITKPVKLDGLTTLELIYL